MAETITVTYRHKTKIGALELDASLSESHTLDQEITEHPIENGGTIADHVRLKPETVRLEGFVSNTPIGRDPDFGRVESAYAVLRRLRDERQPVTISTKLHTYENMILQRLEVPRDATIGSDALRFSADFKQIRTVSGSTATIKIINQGNAKPKKDLGTQPKKAAPAELAKSAWRKTEDFGHFVLKFFEKP